MPHSFYKTFTAKFDMPGGSNTPQQVVPNLGGGWDLGGIYTGSCLCDNPGVFTGPVYYSSLSDLTPAGRTVVEGVSRQFYRLTPNLSAAVDIWIAGNVNDYIPVPFEGRSNLLNERRECVLEQGYTESYAKIPNFGTGSKGRLHLRIDKPFVGKVYVPSTTVAGIRGSFYPELPSFRTLLSRVLLSIDVESRQSCQMTAGQVLTIDFGKYGMTDLPTSEQQPTRSESRVIGVKCNNIPQMAAVDVTLVGSPASKDARALAVNQRSDMAIVLKSGERKIHPTREGATPGTDNRIPLTFNQSTQSGEFQLEAWPIKLQPTVAPGVFNSQVTVKFEFR